MAFTAHDGRTQTVLAEINMVPFIDIVLVLLIIFMVTAPVIQSGIDVSLPKTKTVAQISEARMVVTVDRNERLYLNDTPVNIDALPGKIREKAPDFKRQSVYLRGDSKANWGTMAVVMDRLRQAGMENVSIVTQPIETSAK